jgi:uncharacterized membrane protein YoaK (UPF0700 family)
VAESPDRRHHAPLVGLLTFASGCVDAVTLMAIGGAFTSVITGNLVFTGQAIGTMSLNPALHAIMAVAGYIAGVAAGSRLRQAIAPRARARDWPQAATGVLAVEWVILAAVNIAWFCYRAAPPAGATDVLLIALALALGMRGAAARGIKGNPSTTYMTGALTTLVEAVATGGRRNADAAAAVGLVMFVAGAVCSALLVEHARQTALLPPLAALLLVILIKVGDHRTEQQAERRSLPAVTS